MVFWTCWHLFRDLKLAWLLLVCKPENQLLKLMFWVVCFSSSVITWPPHFFPLHFWNFTSFYTVFSKPQITTDALIIVLSAWVIFSVRLFVRIVRNCSYTLHHILHKLKNIIMLLSECSFLFHVEKAYDNHKWVNIATSHSSFINLISIILNEV